MTEAHLFGLVFAAVGAGLGAVAAVLIARSHRIQRDWRRATGTVVASNLGSIQSPARNATAALEFQPEEESRK